MEANRNGTPSSSATLPAGAQATSNQIADESINVDIPLAADKVELNSDETRYANSGHWTSILDGVSISIRCGSFAFQ